MLPAKCQRNIIPLEIYSNDSAEQLVFYEFERASISIVNYENGAQRVDVEDRKREKCIFNRLQSHRYILALK